MSEVIRNEVQEDCSENNSSELKQVHTLLKTITKITNNIEAQNEIIIQENRSLRDENVRLEIQIKLLVQKDKEINSEVELLITQNKEFRESLDQFKDENNRLRTELKQQNTKLRIIIESLKCDNAKLRNEIDGGVKLLKWTPEPDKKKKSFWKFLCPATSKQVS